MENLKHMTTKNYHDLYVKALRAAAKDARAISGGGRIPPHLRKATQSIAKDTLRRKLQERGAPAAYTEELDYRMEILHWLARSENYNAYIAPIIKRFVSGRLMNPLLEVVFKAVKRGVNELARDWKLRHVMTIGISKAAQARQIDAVTIHIIETKYFPAMEQKRRNRK